MEKRAVKMAANDNAATALCDIMPGDLVAVFGADQTVLTRMQAQSNIPYGNKIR